MGYQKSGGDAKVLLWNHRMFQRKLQLEEVFVKDFLVNLGISILNEIRAMGAITIRIPFPFGSG